ncbi:hypothetical protein DWB61_15775 [Ancylomarina euxinus]|uniref:Uncharacterized protein n=1 Tax=Ancylomarina euxinus TaxID=2283627 RepID=A0A425XXH0_9BACT|nr:hypothetical protein [Ancylomarina euxinus]MCZ4696074.1 hypothetical protein [Ancylomarina euxinus]MUP16483.1 hypothetical protein [Ancylomarina euxinus]RRG19361.1 hypothetical protein DWB61_15775 [Ancylomarina euxinus]
MTNYTPHNADFSLGKRIKSELSLLLILQVIILIFMGINLVYELTLIVIFILLLSIKRNRILYQIEFDDEKREFSIYYYSLVIFRRKETINYDRLNSKLGLKRYGLGSAITTLEFFNKKQIIGEVRVGDKWQWTDEQVKMIHEKSMNSKD